MDIQEEIVVIIEQDKKASSKNDQTRIDGTNNTIAKEIVDASLKPEIDDFYLNDNKESIIDNSKNDI